MFNMCSFFLFSVERSMKKETENGSCIAVFQQLDNLVWAPAVGALGRNRDLPDPSFGFASDTLPSKAFRLIFTEDEGHGDISSFRALATALAATVGTGNIVGVATAIQTGGPGALFWMWMAFFGMATKYAEGLLAIRYRTKDDNGHISGGPMTTFFTGWGEVATTGYFLCGCRSVGSPLWDRNHDPGQFHHGISPSEFWNGSRSG